MILVALGKPAEARLLLEHSLSSFETQLGKAPRKCFHAFPGNAMEGSGLLHLAPEAHLQVAKTLRHLALSYPPGAERADAARRALPILQEEVQAKKCLGGPPQAL